MVLAENKHSKQNWYNWQRKQGFIEWWNEAQREYHSTTGLSHVHKAIYHNALRDTGTADRKLFVERFDQDYKPKSAQEITGFAGRRPEDSRAAIEASKARARAVQSTVKEAEQPQGDTPDIVCAGGDNDGGKVGKI